jgi:hypothetical protein
MKLFLNSKKEQWTLHLASMLIKSVFELENRSMSIEKSSEEIRDDFSTMLSSSYLKIVTGFLFFGVIPLHSIAGILLVEFEKYGMDPMKRSIINLITSQIHCAGVLSNIVFWPFLTWRVIIGPIQPDLSGKYHLCLIFLQSRLKSSLF